MSETIGWTVSVSAENEAYSSQTESFEHNSLVPNAV